MKRAIFTIAILFPILAFAGRVHPEHFYQERWCIDQKGALGVSTKNGARCDCLTVTHAVEFEFANKWAEAIGQSLHYAAETGKRAGIVLIIEDEKRDASKYERLVQTIKFWNLPIDIWTVKPGFSYAEPPE